MMASEGLGGAGEAAPRAERPPSPAVCGRPSGPATAPGLAAGHRTQDVGRNRHRLCRPHLSKRPGAVQRPRAGLGISCPRYAAPPRMRGAQTHQRRGREPGAPPLRGGLRKSAPRLAARPGAPWARSAAGRGPPTPSCRGPGGAPAVAAFAFSASVLRRHWLIASHGRRGHGSAVRRACAAPSARRQRQISLHHRISDPSALIYHPPPPPASHR